MAVKGDPLHAMLTYTPNPPPNVPSSEEAEHRYHGVPSKPRFIARTSPDIWAAPTGMDAYLQASELRRVGDHLLCNVWEGQIDVAMHHYLVKQEVEYTSLDPVRIGVVGESIAPVIIWVGVNPGSLPAERGVEIAAGLRAILLANGVEDVHVEIRESTVTTFKKLYKPARTSDPTVQVREAFSTTLGITICAERTPHIQGTATCFFTTASKPGKLFVLTARHVVFQVDIENDHYVYHGSGPRRNVLFLGTNGFDARIHDAEEDIHGIRREVGRLKDWLELADEIDDLEEARKEREGLQRQLDEAERAVEELEHFLAGIKRDWSDPKKRVLGHIVLSPPLLLSAGNDGFTQDFAVIEVDNTKIDATNFVGNAIDLGTEIPVKTLTAWMHPRPSNKPSFKYPRDRLLRFHGTLSIDEMRNPSPKNIDDRGDPTIMVFKRGCTSGLTIGCLNNIRSVLRTAFKTKPAEYSKEVAVLPRTSKSGAFSKPGDSGAAVINGWGAVAGMITGGGGVSEVSDCTYVTPITFLLNRLEEFGYSANIFPTAADVFA